MTELESSIEIARPVEDVFDLVADPRNDHRWCSRVKGCEQTEGEGPAVGARFAVHHNPTLQRPHLRRVEIVELERPAKVVSVQEDKVGRFTITYLLGPAGGGTRITQRDEIEWRLGPLARPIGTRIVRRHIDAQLRNLKRLLEEGRGAAAPRASDPKEG
jgi:carbon monoxide dehydrogenase subunit G